MIYLLVITKVEKRPFLCSSKFGAVSHSTKIPSEKTKTRSASTIEETRCWRREPQREEPSVRGEREDERFQNSLQGAAVRTKIPPNTRESQKTNALASYQTGANHCYLRKGHCFPMPWASHCLLL